MDIIVKIDTRYKESKSLLEYLESLKYVSIEYEKEPNKLTEKAIKEAENGKTKKIDSVDDLLNDLDS